MASVAAAQRPGAARAAAKQRRQLIFLIVLLAVLAALLALVLPRVMNRSEASSPKAVSAVQALPSAINRAARSGRAGAGADPFRGNPLPNQDARPVTAGGPDPFKGGPAIIVPPRLIPGQIVIGRPGGHRVARHGWIVILASIPTRNGHTSAVNFARGARTRVGSLSILNSSNRRPLRGGYWVVYSGPYPSLSAVSRRAGNVHAAGYEAAYIRELITYRR
jgi:hypothetical protein